MSAVTDYEKLEAKLGFDRIRTAIADRCSTDYASSRVAGESISTNDGEIRGRLRLTDEMRLILMFEDSFPTNGYIDCLPFLKILEGEGGSIDTLSLGKLRTMLETIRKIGRFFYGMKDGIYPMLKRLAAPIKDFPEIARGIDSILDRYGEIKDNASEGLASIRKSIRDKESALSKIAATVLRQAKAEGLVDEDASVSIRDGKYLIPVPSSSKRRLNGIVYDESASGKTSYVEPAEVVALENELSELRFEESREIARILREFSDFLRPYVPDLENGATFIGEVDFLMAKAQIALDIIAGMPVISEDGQMHLRKARHPLLEKALKKEGRSIVPLTINLDPKKRILLISGPNAGGKSVCLKTAGLLQYMFQWGMLIPTSEASELPVFERIMLSIGDDQSIDNDLSTYSSFLADIRSILESAGPGTLILIDEFGSGTEPAAGGAIAEAILAELDRRGAYGVITTHYTNLKLYASAPESHVINGAMLFDTSAIAPLFKLESGIPGNSFAFELARKTGLPEAIVKDAEERAGEGFVDMERNLRKIARNRRALEEKLQKIRSTDKALESLADKYEKELQEIKQQRKSILDDAKKEAEQIVKGANREVEKTIRVIRESQAEKEQTLQARKDLQGFMSALEAKKEKETRERDAYIDRKLSQLERRKEKENARKQRRGTARTEPASPSAEETKAFRSGAFKVGEKVRIMENGMAGEIACVSGKSLTIIIGNIRSTVDASRVERISSNEFKAATKSVESRPRMSEDPALRERKLSFKPELDVRGERLQDAIDIVTHYIDDAIMLSFPSVRIIHGKGTGVLREEIQKYLRTVPGVASAKDESIQLGGSGVTVVTFE